MPDNFEIKTCADGCGAQLAVTKRQISLYGQDGWFLTEHAKQATDKTAAPYQPDQPEGNIMANQPSNQPRQPAQMPNQPREGEQNPNEQQPREQPAPTAPGGQQKQ